MKERQRILGGLRGMIRSGLGVLLVGCNSVSPNIGNNTNTNQNNGGPCAAGVHRCQGNTLEVCQNGVFVEEVVNVVA